MPCFNHCIIFVLLAIYGGANEFIIVVNKRILQSICVGMYHIVFFLNILDPTYKDPPFSGSAFRICAFYPRYSYSS